MRPRQNISNSMIAWLSICAAGLIVACGPPALREFPRMALIDAAMPALAGLWPLSQSLSRSLGDRSSGELERSSDVRQLMELRHSVQTLEYENARLRSELDRIQQRLADPLSETDFLMTKATKSRDLLNTELTPARVLGSADQLLSHDRRLIGLGQRAGLLGEELVLEGPGLLLDQGRDEGVERDQLITSGRAVVGRVWRVGQWTSLYVPVTDTLFRAGARVIRRTPQGPVLGPQGMLGGDGQRCKLWQVPGTDAVSAGDAVYCDDPLLDAPLIVGIVSQAELLPGDPYWTIQVAPVVATPPSQVLVLKTVFNPERLTTR